MTLRLRAVIASAVALVALLAMGAFLLVQYSLTTVVGQGITEVLSPAADATSSLALAQANASGSLSDYIMLERQESLSDYRSAISQATSLLDQIDGMLSSDGDLSLDDMELRALAAQARTTQDAWIAADAEPVLVLMQSGQRAKAMRLTNTRAAWDAYDAMTAAATALDKAVNRTRDEGFAVMATFTQVLGVALVVVGALVILGLLAFMWGLRRWILRPLGNLRHDLQQAARTPGHETPITATGPPELHDVATDAELLRRGLVAEIDEAQAAREGLAQDAPLVAAVRDELSPGAAVQVPGLVVAGLSQSAEGVVAGDWWDQLARPDGTLALVLADVSGHGPESGVTALRVRTIMRAGLLAGLSPEQVVQMAADSCRDDRHFVTGLILIVDPAGGTISWLNAGHHPAILVTADKDAALCEPTGPLISSLGGEWTVRSMYFRPGDVLVAFTDGLVESRNADGDELESSRVSLLIRGMDLPVRENPAELITRLLAQVRHRAADWRRDDVTLVAVSRPR